MGNVLGRGGYLEVIQIRADEHVPRVLRRGLEVHVNGDARVKAVAADLNALREGGLVHLVAHGNTNRVPMCESGSSQVLSGFRGRAKRFCGGNATAGCLIYYCEHKIYNRNS